MQKKNTYFIETNYYLKAMSCTNLQKKQAFKIHSNTFHLLKVNDCLTNDFNGEEWYAGQ